MQTVCLHRSLKRSLTSLLGLQDDDAVESFCGNRAKDEGVFNLNQIIMFTYLKFIYSFMFGHQKESASVPMLLKIREDMTLLNPVVSITF